MCIIVYKPENKQVEKDVLKTCFESNNDGFGFSYVENESLYRLRSVSKDFEKFWSHYQKHQHKSLLMHFRVRTHGEINIENCHPYVINDDWVLFHNGTLTAYGKLAHKRKDKPSDTLVFTENLMQPLLTKHPEAFSDEDSEIKFLVEDHIFPSRMALMNSSGKVILLNETSASARWNEGVWFSNDGYKVRKGIVVPFRGNYNSAYATPYKEWQNRKVDPEDKFTDRCLGYAFEAHDFKHFCNCKEYDAHSPGEVHKMRVKDSCFSYMFNGEGCFCRGTIEHEQRCIRGTCSAPEYFHSDCKCLQPLAHEMRSGANEHNAEQKAEKRKDHYEKDWKDWKDLYEGRIC
jgi:hypothetical protein